MLANFFTLTPERILDSVEAALKPSAGPGVRATGNIQALNSVENRVYLIELEDESSIVAKFYRPGRWSPEQIAEEHRFTWQLAEMEVPAVPPMKLTGAHPAAETLALSPDGILFAVFPRVRARIRDELDNRQLRQLGRFVARLHAKGSSFKSIDGGTSKRVHLGVKSHGAEPLAFLQASSFLSGNARIRYTHLTESLLSRIEPMLENVKAHAIHGDCHLGNVLWPSSPNDPGPFFVDFDDMMIGPPVQDIWMIIRGRDEEAIRQRDELLAGYEEMREFDRSTLRLIEPLRALRMIHYSAWIARRWEDPSFPRMFPTFATEKYWQTENEALEEILELITAIPPNQFWE